MFQERGIDLPSSKNGVAVDIGHQCANATVVYEKYGNQHDEKDMNRMGKLQELRVNPILWKRDQFMQTLTIYIAQL
jgi:actin-related protein